ncbi:MAG: HEAT repeat domain-containing protein [Acidobacteriales bacterium]|nr:HEAT repeat domain-containing protein [Terriglobales bacterium]
MIRKCVFSLLIVSSLAQSAAAQEQFTPDSFGFLPAAQAQQSAAAAREDERYNDGTDSIDEQKWSRALDAFNDVIAIKGRRTDAALYWKAYVLNKLGRRGEAQTTIAELRRSFPRSNWIREAGALEVEMKSGSGKPVNPESESDEELKILAINSLMNSDEARAIPMLQRVLESSSNSPRLKEKALFVLAQSDSQQAQQLILSVARGQTHPPMQLKAIQYLAIHGGKQNQQAMEQIYRSSTDTNVKRTILQAFITCGCEQSTLDVLREERDPELRRRAIHNLGAMGATEQLRQLFQSSTSAEDKEKIMEALGVAGDTNTLAEIARTPGDARVRRRAIHGLGISGGKQAAQTLVAIYSSDNDKEVRKAAAEALFIQGADRELVALARKETDPEMRRYLVQKLSIMGSKEAQEYMLEILNK